LFLSRPNLLDTLGLGFSSNNPDDGDDQTENSEFSDGNVSADSSVHGKREISDLIDVSNFLRTNHFCNYFLFC
jgi:hypothetical protein